MNTFFKMLNKDEKVEYSKKELITEHKRLVDILKGTDRAKQLSEAHKQEKELQELENENN